MLRKKATSTKKKVNPVEILKKSRADRISEELESQGVVFQSLDSLDINSDYLHLPAHITEIPAKELGEYLNAFTQQKAYMRTMQGWAECFMIDAKDEYYKASQSLYTELSKSKLSEKAKERQLATDPSIQEEYQAYIEASQKCRIIELNISNIEDIIFMLSREVSRRGVDYDENTRNYNVGKH